jgi:hypothetical protein
MSAKMKKTKWFWPWQDQEEEQWLEKQSKQGNHLSKLSAFGRYTFEKGAPKDFVYRLDFMLDDRGEKENYLQIFRDAGWEYLGEMNGWHYFRKEADAEASTEIFTDQHSKVKKYERVITYQASSLGILMLLFITVIEPWEQLHWLSLIVTLIYIVLLVLQIIIVLNIFKRIQTLKENISE